MVSATKSTSPARLLSGTCKLLCPNSTPHQIDTLASRSDWIQASFSDFGFPRSISAHQLHAES